MYSHDTTLIDKYFWPKVDKSDQHGGCWFWSGYKLPHGYGQLSAKWFNGKNHALAHHISYELNYGPVPNGMKVLHSCDKPPCVNPDHLFVGTQLDNMRDMNQKGRHTRKLTREQVQDIRDLHSHGTSGKELARQFGIHKTNVRFIVNYQTWKD